MVLLNTADSFLQLPFNTAYLAIHGITVAFANTSEQYRWYRKEIEKQPAGATTLDDWKARWKLVDQMRTIESHHSPSARVERTLNTLANTQFLKNAIQHSEWAWQRLNRGYDDREVWNIDKYVCRRLGDQMLQLADNAHGYPGNAEYPTYERWVADLRHYGTNLTAAGNSDQLELEDEAIWDDAAEALHWAADHLRNLWD